MLKITIPAQEQYDEIKEEFFMLKEQVLSLEHSLVSISKWEAKWKKPFLSQTKKTDEETIDYIRCMTLTQNVDPDLYKCMSAENLEDIRQYIESPMSATWFAKSNQPPSRRIITSEIIYSWMVRYRIPFEAQKWHLNRLMTLIRLCNLDAQPPKKMSKAEIMSRNHALNASRRARLHSKG